MRALRIAYAIAVLALLVPALVVQARPVTLKGYVVDPRGNPVPDAIVEVYRDHVKVLSTRTAKTGAFVITVDPGDYTFRIFKRGYELREVTLEITPGMGGILGEFTLNYAFKVLPEAYEVSTFQGEVKELSVRIANVGYYTERANITILAPPGWYASLQTPKGLEVETIALGPEDVKELKLLIRPSRSALGDYNVSLVLECYTTRIVENILFHVKARDWRLLSTDFPSLVAVRGGSAKFKVLIENTLDVETDILLSVEAPKGWSARLEDEEGRAVAAVSLPPGGKTYVFLKVKVPEDASPGVYPFVVAAEALGASSRLRLEVVVIEAGDELRIETEEAYLDAYAGSEVKIPLKVVNEGLEGTPVFIEVKASEGATWRLVDNEGRLVAGFYLGPNEVKQLVLDVRVSPKAKPGLISIVVTAKGRKSVAQVEVGVNVLGTYSFELLTKNLYLEMSAGGSARFRLFIKNTGTIPLRNLYVEFYDVPKGVRAVASPALIRELAPGDVAEFIIRIDTSPSLAPGFYNVPFKVGSEGVVEKRVLLVRVTTRVGYGYLFLSGLMIASILLAAIYSRFRARAVGSRLPRRAS